MLFFVSQIFICIDDVVDVPLKLFLCVVSCKRFIGTSSR